MLKILLHPSLALASFLCISMASVYADVVVIVSVNNPITKLTDEQTAKIFLGKVDTFPNDTAAFPIDQAEGSAIRDEFYSKIVHKSSTQVNAYWAKIIFSGDSRPPKQMDGNLAVRKAVANNPNAVGYIDKSAVNSSVKVILAP